MGIQAKTSLRAFLIGFFAFALLTALLSVFHKHPKIFEIALIFGILALAVFVARVSDRPAWWHGLLSGLGLCIPGFLVLLYSHFPHPRLWVYVAFGHAVEWWWVACLCVLLISSGGTQSVALWFQRRWVGGALGFVATIGLVAAVWFGALRMSHSVDVHDALDKPLPSLSLTTLDGKPILPSEMKAQITIIDFWGTWCSGCVAELPALNSVYAEYASNPNVRFLLVNSELAGDTPEKIASFLRRKPTSIPVALDPAQSYYKLGVDSLPLLLVVDARGHIRFEDGGYENDETTTRRLHREIDSLMAAN